MAKYKILSTKKLDPSQWELVRKKDVEIVEKEFFSINHLIGEEEKSKLLELAKSNNEAAVVLTSANTVDALHSILAGQKLPVNWKIYCLSGRTKTIIEESGLLGNNIVAEANDASGLATEIIQSGIKEITFPCGNRRRDELPLKLQEAGIKVNEIVLYKTVNTPSEVESDFDCVLFFSPSGVESFFSVNQLKEDAVCIAIGKTTADSISTFTGNRIITSKSPRPESLISAMLFYFQTRPAIELNKDGEQQEDGEKSKI